MTNSTDDARKEAARRIIRGATLASAPISSVLISVSADTTLMTALNVSMIQALATLFEIKLEARDALRILYELSGSRLGQVTAKTLLGLVPGVGNLANSIIASGYTEALGWSAYRYFSDRSFSPSTLNDRKRVFICYGHIDYKYVERLLVNLKPVRNLLQVFVDTSLTPGVEWRKEIETALAEARVAALFISPDFVASDFIQKYELPALIASAKEKSAIIFPILVSPVVKTDVVISLLEYHSPVTNFQPLIDMKRPQREKMFVQIAEAIIDIFAG